MKRMPGLIILGLTALFVGGCLDVNERPVASFTRTPAVGLAPLSVFFDAAESSDPDGAIVAYTWDFGDDSATDSTSGVTATHTYAEPGTYSVTLTVANSLGQTATTSRTVTVTTTSTGVTASFTFSPTSPAVTSQSK